MITIEMTEKEAEVLLNLIDAAVKSIGLSASEAALLFAGKIRQSYAENNNDKAPPTLKKQE